LQKSATAAEPSDDAVLAAQRAYEAFDNKDLQLAEELFTKTITEWRGLDRGVEEITSFLLGRANVRLDRQNYVGAKADTEDVIKLMEPIGEKPNGVAAYRQYTNAFVERGLAREGLRDWSGAVSDYDKAVSLSGSKGDDLNPFVLSYRGRARSQTGDYEGALADFKAADGIYSRVFKNKQQAAASRANEAITLYSLGRRDEAVKKAKNVILRTPGYTDMHVLLAADAWDRGNKVKALEEWDLACSTDTGCRSYKDVDGWLTNRGFGENIRWPTSLIEMQRAFLEKKGGVGT